MNGNSTCKFCKRTFDEHCIGNEYRPCSENIAHNFAPNDTEDGRTCRVCGEPLQDHCDLEVNSLNIFGQPIEVKADDVLVYEVVAYRRCSELTGG